MTGSGSPAFDVDRNEALPFRTGRLTIAGEEDGRYRLDYPNLEARRSPGEALPGKLLPVGSRRQAEELPLREFPDADDFAGLEALFCRVFAAISYQRYASGPVAGYSPEARGRSEVRHPAEAPAPGTQARRHLRHGRGQPLPRGGLPAGPQPALRDPARVGRPSYPSPAAWTTSSASTRSGSNDNTVRYKGPTLQIPADRHHYVKARVRVHEYPDHTLAVFHGPGRLALYQADGSPHETIAWKAASAISCCSSISYPKRACAGGRRLNGAWTAKLRRPSASSNNAIAVSAKSISSRTSSYRPVRAAPGLRLRTCRRNPRFRAETLARSSRSGKRSWRLCVPGAF